MFLVVFGQWAFVLPRDDVPSFYNWSRNFKRLSFEWKILFKFCISEILISKTYYFKIFLKHIQFQCYNSNRIKMSRYRNWKYRQGPKFMHTGARQVIWKGESSQTLDKWGKALVHVKNWGIHALPNGWRKPSHWPNVTPERHLSESCSTDHQIECALYPSWDVFGPLLLKLNFNNNEIPFHTTRIAVIKKMGSEDAEKLEPSYWWEYKMML